AGYADELSKLGKEARQYKDAAEKQKKSVSEWTKLMDDFIQKSEDLKSTLGKPGTTQAQAKAAHNQVKAACTNCHTVFRIDEDSNCPAFSARPVPGLRDRAPAPGPDRAGARRP